MDLIEFFKAAAFAMPLKNPVDGGQHWYHGTGAQFEDEETGEPEDGGGRIRTPDRTESESFEHAGKHWNTGLGAHFTSLPDVAEEFAHKGGGYDQQRVAHAKLHMANPKHYDSEHDLTRDAINYAHKAGYSHLPDHQNGKDSFAEHGIDGLDEDDEAHEVRVPRGHAPVSWYDHPLAGGSEPDTRKAFQHFDDHGADEKITGFGHQHTEAGVAENYLNTHPHRAEVVEGFKKHLQDQGHDGVTYGNEWEGPRGHTCAVPFNDDHINIHHWDYTREEGRKKQNQPAPHREIPGQQHLIQHSYPAGRWEGPDKEDLGKASRKTAADDDWRMQHRAPSDDEHGMPLHDLTNSADPEGTSMPADVYTHPHYYSQMSEPSNVEAHRVIKQVRGKPEADVHIYRALPPEHAHKGIGTGDWVTTSKAYAQQHAMNSENPKEDWAVIHSVVKAKHLRTDGDDFREYGYTGPHTQAQKVSMFKRAAWEKRPEWAGPTEGASEEEQSKQYDQARGERNDWTHRTRRALSLGHTTLDEAKEAGYYPSGQDSSEGGSSFGGERQRNGWQPLKGDHYHVTTHLPGVLQHGLKSRRELGQEQGLGLGGGEDDTVSTTTNRELAGHILKSLHEYHGALNGKTSVQDMQDEADSGKGADRPWGENLTKMMHSSMGEHRYDSAKRGMEAHHQISTQSEMDEEHGPGTYVPHPLDKGIGQPGAEIHTPRGKLHADWERPATEEEGMQRRGQVWRAHSALREHAGGRPDPVFFSHDVKGFANADPKNFGLVHLRPKPYAQGYPVSGMNEWRTAAGDAFDIAGHQKQALWSHEHDWSPTDRIFAPTPLGLDPRLFNEETKKMKPEVSDVILGDLGSLWDPLYPDWKKWARVYLAGSEASHWFGNNDLDTLIGINHEEMRKACPEFEHVPDADIDHVLTMGLKANLNDEEWTAPWDGQTWHRTYFVNPDSYDIRDIKPYAAYEIISKKWYVTPVDTAATWSAQDLPEAFFDEAEDLVKTVHAIEQIPDPRMRDARGAALFDYVHGDRSRAFSKDGEGVYDVGNVVWKYLDLHPDKPLEALVQMKRAFENSKSKVIL